EDLRPLALRLHGDGAFEERSERALEVLLEGLSGFRRHAVAEAGAGAEDQVADHAIGLVEIQLHDHHAADRVADEDRAAHPHGVQNGEHVGRVLLNRVSALRLVRAAVTPMIDHDHLVRASEGERLEVPDAAVRRPRMEEDDRYTFPVGIVVDLHPSIVRVWHVAPSSEVPFVIRFDQLVDSALRASRRRFGAICSTMEPFAGPATTSSSTLRALEGLGAIEEALLDRDPDNEQHWQELRVLGQPPEGPISPSAAWGAALALGSTLSATVLEGSEERVSPESFQLIP